MMIVRIAQALILISLPLTPLQKGHAAEPSACDNPQTLKDLQKMSGEQLKAIFLRSEVGTIPTGHLDGKLLYLTDKLPKIKIFSANLVWRGKYFGDDSYFSNVWIGNRHWLNSCSHVGTSWFDGKPALILDYRPRTPLFANMRDEFREVAPGLYVGVAFEREPCPVFRGILGLEVPCCKTGCGKK